MACSRNDRGVPVSSPYFDNIIIKAERTYDSGYRQRALKFILLAHAHAKDLTVADEMNYCSYVSELYRKDYHDNDKYFDYADTMLQILEKHHMKDKLPSRYAQAYNMKADALFAKGLYNESYDFYYQAKKMAKDNADSCSLGQYSYSLGMALFRQQRYLESARHFREAYNEITTCNDVFVYFYKRQEILDNIGLCYNRSQMYDSAMVFYQLALDYIDANYMRFNKDEKIYISAKAVVYGNMADIYTARKVYDTAEKLLKKSIDINLQKGYTNNDAIIDQVKLANLYYAINNYPEMKNTLGLIKAELDTLPDKQVERSWNRLMWQYYTYRADSVEAYRYLLAFERMNDSLTATNKALMATDVDARLRTIEKQYLLSIQNKNIQQVKIYLIVATLVAVMAIIIISLVTRNARRSRKNVETLTKLNNKISEQKEKLETALTELELKDKDKSRIMRSVAHDVMNPIAAIMAMSDILASEADNYSDEHKEILKLIKEACANSLSLSKDILEAAATIDKRSMPKEWVNINKLISSSVELLNINAAAKNQKVVINSHQEDIMAYVNREKIWRVLNNLIANAIKFSYKNSQVFIDVSQQDGMVHIAVKDNGIGIPEKNKPHVFDMFTEAKIPGTAGEAPHGLGLSISLQIARAHNGNIYFDSEVGKGTTFHLEFPVNAAQ